MEHFNKPHLTIDEQITLLQSRDLLINNPKRAARHLSNISYYRLSAYMLPYKIVENGVYQDKFKKYTTWEFIYDLYVFDRKLRLLIFDAVERIEIAIRTQIIYQLSLKYGAHWQDDPDILKVDAYKRKDGKVVICNNLKQRSDIVGIAKWFDVVNTGFMGFPDNWKEETLWK